ncbi:polyadenylate-binding protein 3-like [Ictalurus furcatus]|uniref:polyadenylate-binding protein 3-like n=1 Tax=Ictalurus furcatus TaxID=66913 RepID=UPI002350C2AF|nr:polyadenylate-binding protein 3-like [Ictalurus furcatus]XP_053466741.1 polyadenylate-binding protein 3-like [Ictalurus furcatus]XP_053466742.1 polyadenylate-binding protein 3-like [Ictalurus furcatus]
MNQKSVMSSLYVGGLHPEVMENMLVEKFSPAGRIHSIRLCRDRKTGSSLGYAFVNFHRRAEAERALEMLNYEPLMGRPMRIMWSHKDSSLRNTGMGKLFVRNLDNSIGNMALHDIFSTFGKVLSCTVVNNETGSKGYGIVHFESLEAANMAIERLNGKLLNGCKVFVERFKPYEGHKAEAGPQSQDFTNIYIRNLGEVVDEIKLKNIFSKFGPVMKVHVETDEDKRSGYVKFEKHEDAQRAVEEMNGMVMYGKQMYVTQAQTKAERPNHKFEQVKMENGRSRGSGFMHSSCSQETTKAGNLHWTAQTMEPQYVQNMPDGVDPAPGHQETSGTITPSSSQVPCVTVESTVITTPTSVDTVPVADSVPAVESVPAEHTVPAVESVPAEHTVPAVESVPAEHTLPAVESVPAEHTLPAVESVPVEHTVPAVESVPVEYTVPAVESVPAEHTVPAAESVPVEYTVPAVESVPVEHTVPAVESVPVVDTLPAVESVPVPAADKLPAPTQAPNADVICLPSTCMVSESEAANMAIERPNGKLLNARKVFVERFKPREEHKAEAGPQSQFFTNIYIRNLGEVVDETKLKNIFSKFGPVLNVHVVTDVNRKPKRSGYVKFERHEDAQKAVQEMNGMVMYGKQMYVTRAQTKAERPNHKFEQVKMENGRSRGSGFVHSSSSQEATKARNLH